MSEFRFRLILPNCIAFLPCHTSYMHHARFSTVVLNSASGVCASVLLLHGLGRWVDASVDPIFGWTFGNVFRRASLPLLPILHLYSLFPPVDLLLSVSRCFSVPYQLYSCSHYIAWDTSYYLLLVKQLALRVVVACSGVASRRRCSTVVGRLADVLWWSWSWF